MPKIVMKSGCSDEHYDGDCEVVVINVTPELIEKLKRRAKIALDAFAADREVRSVDWWDYTANWHDNGGMYGDDSPFTDAETDSLYEGDFLVLTDGREQLFNDDNVSRTECERLVLHVCDTCHGPQIEVEWRAYPKHCDCIISTPCVGIDDLEATLTSPVSA